MRAVAPYAMGAALLLCVYGWGHHAGRMAQAARANAELAALQARSDALAEAARKLDAARLETERRLTDALARIEVEALADPDAGRPALGPASVQRLGRIGRAD